jgi:type 1 fimbriae regulatory protein FimB/type 1 fimbriae regulatory protein FimE
MLRHGAGFKLANQGIDTRSIQAFMGHATIASTAVYTETPCTQLRTIRSHQRSR